MRGLRQAAAGVIAIVAFAAGADASTHPPARDSDGRRARHVNVTVTPATGAPDQRFLVRFKARNELRRRDFYDVEATGPEPAVGDDCDNDSAIFRHARLGNRVRVSLPSRRTSPHWCPGRYEGTIWLEDYRPSRERGEVVGEFSFEVKDAPAPAPRSAPGRGRGASGKGSRPAP